MGKLTLTPEQQAVVENRGGSLLVSAAAGSGKTKVLVDRLFLYVTAEHHNVDDFLIITFTEAAAAELRSKISGELSKRLAEHPGDAHLRQQLLRVYQTDIKTVDAFCTGLLRQNTHLLSREGDRHALTPDFRVLDQGDSDLVRRRVLDHVLADFYETLDGGGELLADTLGAGRDDQALAELVLELFGKLQSHAYPEQWLREQKAFWAAPGNDFEATPYAQELRQAVARESMLQCLMLRRAAERMEGDVDLEAAYGEKFLEAAKGFQALAGAESWEDARQRGQAIVYPRLGILKGRTNDPDILEFKAIWNNCKDSDKKRIQPLLAVSGEEAMEDLNAVAPAMQALLQLTLDFGEAYRVEKLRLNAVDFSDEEHLALRLLVAEDGSPTPLGCQVADRYREIMVDEYQDTNEVQNAIFRAVSRDSQNIFTVGDVKQSIYRFRLADPTIFLGKYNRFKSYLEAKDGEERKILLSKNFRSRQEILDATNFIFANIMSQEMGEMDYGEDEALHFGAAYYPPRTDCRTEFHLISAQRRSAENPYPVKAAAAEAAFVAKRIDQLLKDQYPVTGEDGTLRPCRPEDIVILMRSPRSRIQVFSQALAERDIPCSFEESGDFFHTMEISTMVALLELVDNPRQDVPLIAVLRSPIFGFTPDRLAEIRGKTRKGEYYDALVQDEGEDCVRFLEQLNALRSAARDMSVHRLIWHIYNTLNVLGVFGAMDGGPARRENLIALSRHAEKFESSGYKGLFAFVTQLRRLLEQGDAPMTKASSAVSGVRMMSIHKSKGLEFPIVILADLNHTFSTLDFETPVLVHPEMGLGPKRIDLDRKIMYPTLARQALERKLRRENLAEEQRVLYVAMTRPKEKLILVDTVYGAEGHLRKLSPSAACPVFSESVAEQSCYGDWILLPLLCRGEAKVLRDYAGLVIDTLYVGEDAPWQVAIHDSEDFRPGRAVTEEAEEPSPVQRAFDPGLLSYRYPYERETQLPAKVTATQLKGRSLDDEISENAAHTPFLRPLSQPKFRRKTKGLTAAERGTATHLVLQFLDFNNRDVASQMDRMLQRELLTPEQAKAVDAASIQALLDSPLADDIRNGRNVKREYPFTQLLDARTYDPSAAAGDQILLQGVVDCCYETDEGIAVVDFKTDHVESGQELEERVERYRNQLTAYSIALERVLEQPVVRKTLYFLPSRKTIEL